MRYGQHWNKTRGDEPGDPPPPVWIVQESYPGRCRDGHWYTAEDNDATPAVFNDERDAERYMAARKAERTDDDEPTPYHYRIVEGWATKDGGWDHA